MLIRYFLSLIQLVLSNQSDLFIDSPPNRDEILRNIFKKGCLLPPGTVTGDSLWGIDYTRYITNDRSWLFGYLLRAKDPTGTTTLPHDARSFKDIRPLSDYILKATPFFLNIKSQHLFTQSNWYICRTPKSASERWMHVLGKIVPSPVTDVSVQSITDTRSFYQKLDNIVKVQKAYFEFHGHNFLNDKKIRDLLIAVNPTKTKGLGLVLRNIIEGLGITSQEFQNMLSYVTRGGGNAQIEGLGKNSGDKVIVKTQKEAKVYNVKELLDIDSDDKKIKIVFDDIKSQHEAID